MDGNRKKEYYERFGFSDSGTFRAAGGHEGGHLLAVICGDILLVIVLRFFIFMLSGEFYTGKENVFARVLWLILSFAVVIASVGAMRIALSGAVFRYSTDNEKFVFWPEKDPSGKTYIYYSDIVRMDISERKAAFLKPHGFNVTFVTRSLGNITIQYLHSAKVRRARGFDSTPFAVIADRLDALGK